MKTCPNDKTTMMTLITMIVTTTITTLTITTTQQLIAIITIIITMTQQLRVQPKVVEKMNLLHRKINKLKHLKLKLLKQSLPRITTMNR